MTSTICDQASPLPAGAADAAHFTATGEFLAEYTAWLCGCGATCIRIDKNVTRIARAWGMGCDITVMPRNVTIVLHPCHAPNSSRGIFTAKLKPCGINFDINTRLSRLSWNVADGHLTVEDAFRTLQSITIRRYSHALSTTALVGLANASFCRLFDGDATAMLIVLCATLAGYAVKEILLGFRTDIRLVFIICAFVSSALCGGARLFGWSDTPDIALATSVLYLIPGVPYINAASDLIDRHYLCAFSRFTDASVLTACLSAGLCLSVKLLGLEWF